MLWKALRRIPARRRPPTTGAPATASARCSWSTARRPPPSSPPGWASRRPPSAGTSTPWSPPAGWRSGWVAGARHRGRGRPARRFHLTDAGRSAFPHAYDDLALTALRYVAASGGPDAVRAVAEQQLAGLEARASSAVEQAVSRRIRRRRSTGPRHSPSRSPPRATLPRPRRSPAAGSSASTTARWRTWRRSSRSCARPRPR